MYKLKKKHLIALVGACLMAGASYTAFAADDNVALPNNNDSAVTHHAPNSVSVGSANINEKEKGAIAIGNGATVSHDDQSAKTVNLPFLGPVTVRPFAPGNGLGGIAIGERAFVHTMTAGEHERIIALNHSDDRTKMMGGIAIGYDTHARVGTIDLGNRDYTGEIGDINFGGDSLNVIDGVGTTTIGTNSINSGNFATINGAYNAITNRPTQGGISGYLSNISRATQGLGATITGTFNSIENNFAKDHAYSGLANSIVGVANKVNKSNATIIIGAGNEVSNSYLTATNGFMRTLSSPPKTIKALADKIRTYSQDNILASVGVFGGANKVTSAAFTNITGVNNTVAGKPDAQNDTLKFNKEENYPGYSVFNMISGFSNNNKLSSHTVIMGSYNSVTNSNHIIGLGNSINVNSTDTKTASNDVIIGFNTKTSILTPKDNSMVKMGEDGKWYKAADIQNLTYFKGSHYTSPGYYKPSDTMKNNPIAPIAESDYNQYFDVKPILKSGITNTMVLGNNVMANLDNSVYLGTDSTEAKDGSTVGMLPYPSYDFDPIPVAPVPANPPKLTEAAASSPAPAPLDTASSPSEAPATAANSTPSIFAGATPAGIVSVGSPGKERRIENVAAGYINNNSTDAINGSQLKAVIDHVYTKTKSDERRTQVKGENGITVTSATDDKGANVYTVSLDKDTVSGMSKTTTVKAGDNVSLKTEVNGSDTTYTVNVTNDAINKAVKPALDKKASVNALRALTKEVNKKATIKQIVDIEREIGTKANKSLNNITSSGKTVIKKLANEAVKVGNGINTTVTTTTKGDNTIYHVNISNEAINNAIAPALKKKADISIVNALANKVDTKADISTVNALANKVDTKADISTVNALANKVDTKADISTVNALANKVDTKADSSAVNALSDKVNNKANIDLDNISDKGEVVVKTLANEAIKIENGENTTVTSKTADNMTVYKVNISKDNIKAAVKEDLVTKADADAGNLSPENITAWKAKLDVPSSIAYSANGKNANTVALKNGFNFTDGTNTTASVDTNGTVTYNLTPDMTNINSISGTDGKAKITFGDALTVNNKVVTGVAAGKVAKDSTDAINGSQLYDVSSKLDNKVNVIDHKTSMELGDLRNDMNQGLALGAALAGLHPTSYDPLRKTQLMAAVGFHHSNFGFALGLAHNNDENFMYHGSVAFNNNDIMGNVGITWKWGKKKEIDKLPEQYRQGPITSVYVMQKEIEALKAEVKELKEMLKNKK